MSEKDNFLAKEMKKTEKYPMVIHPNYWEACIVGICGVALLVCMQRNLIFAKDPWFFKYGILFFLFIGCVLLLRGYHFTEKRLYVKILGITIRDIPKRDIMQIGVITYNQGMFFLIVLQTAAQYIPYGSNRNKQKYISQNRKNTFLIDYNVKYDIVIREFYGEYDFYEESLLKRLCKNRNNE
jgi:hypothetical protein